MPYVYLIVILHGMVETLMRFDRADVDDAELAFVSAMEHHIQNFNEYDGDEIDACLEDGFEGWHGDCSIQLHWADN